MTKSLSQPQNISKSQSSQKTKSFKIYLKSKLSGNKKERDQITFVKLKDLTPFSGHQPRSAKVSRLMAFFLVENLRPKKPAKKNICKMLKMSLVSFMIF
jgi:hypothetical protein